MQIDAAFGDTAVASIEVKWIVTCLDFETLRVEVVDPKNFTAVFYHLKVGNPIIRDFFMFLIAQIRGRDAVGGINFGYIGKPIPTFLIKDLFSIKVISISRTVFSPVN